MNTAIFTVSGKSISNGAGKRNRKRNIKETEEGAGKGYEEGSGKGYEEGTEEGTEEGAEEGAEEGSEEGSEEGGFSAPFIPSSLIMNRRGE